MAGRVHRQSITVALLAAALVFAAGPAPTSEQLAVMERISADSLRGHLSFLSSDLLEGRATPSRGLDLAAEYIAAQFRRVGLSSIGDDYFQTGSVDGKPANNVIGLLRGSDPALNDTYVILSAHYDHIGMRPNGDDKVFNGANDDGSGTVSVIEIASALAASPVHSKRSILFMAFFGEEKGLLGSRYYTSHPLVPLEKTIAQVNLEQVGRTDSTDGPQIDVAYVTGFDYSNLAKILGGEAPLAGVKIGKDPTEKYFERSDNLYFAQAGVPAHTVYVAADFSDYHRVGDEWQKINYTNMTRVDRGIALGLLRLASDAPPPAWNTSDPAARRYADAAKKPR